MKKSKRFFRALGWIFLGLLLVFAILWPLPVPRFLEKPISHRLLVALQGALPIPVESLRLRTRFGDLVLGQVGKVVLVFSLSGQKVTLQGPVDWSKSSNGNELKADLDILSLENRATLTFLGKFSPTFASIYEAELKIKCSSWKQPQGFEIGGLELLFKKEAAQLKGDLKIQSLKWAFSDGLKAFDFKEGVMTSVIQFATDGELEPVSFETQLGFQAGDFLSGEHFFTLPLKGISLGIEGSKKKNETVLKATGKNLSLAELTQAYESGGGSLPLRIEAGSAHFHWLAKNPFFTTPETWIHQIKSLSLPWNLNLDIKQLKFKHPTLPIAAKSISIHLPISSHRKTKAEISDFDFAYRKLQLHSQKTDFELFLDPTHLAIQLLKPWDLKGPELSIHFEKLKILNHFTDPQKSRWKLQMDLNAEDLSRWTGALCASHPLPPAQLMGKFYSIEGLANELSFLGRLRADLFGGWVDLSGLKIFDLWTSVPEVQFTTRWERLQLAQIGSWLNFGDMNGTLRGFLQEVVFQSWLPTNYRFFIAVSPNLDQKDVVFSPDAMKNFVRLFAGHDWEEHLPGIAKWLAFGWPSRVFGGYDIKYAGISAFSQEGAILVETLDPPEIVEKEEGKRFILYGPRFKIPIRSSRYPVVLDAAGLSNMVHNMMQELDHLKESKLTEEEKEKRKNEENKNESATCFLENF